MRPIALILLPALLSMSTAFAQWDDRPFVGEGEPPLPSSVVDKDTTWKEGTTNLPPWPKDGDLVEFDVDDPSSQFRQFVDGKHILTGGDAAVRYTLVVQSRSGVRNISFEGLRCTLRGAFKIYAYGIDDRFERTESEWIPIRGNSQDKIHRALHERILCIPRGMEPRPTKDMIRAMQARDARETGTGLMPD